MTDHFVRLVSEMRVAQREYSDKPTQAGLAERKKLEIRVDRWLEDHMRDLAQLDLWRAAVGGTLDGRHEVIKTDEEPGAYIIDQPTEEEQNSGA